MGQASDGSHNPFPASAPVRRKGKQPVWLMNTWNENREEVGRPQKGQRVGKWQVCMQLVGGRPRTGDCVSRGVVGRMSSESWVTAIYTHDRF